MPSSRLANSDFRAGDWLVQPQLARIKRGDETVRVTPRAMAVLVHLAEANGAVVSRGDLLDAVWPRMAVTPDALSQCLVELRRAFGDDSKSPKTIETIRRMGVRLIVPITVEGGAEPEPPIVAEVPTHESVRQRAPRRERLWRAAGVVAAAAALGAVLLFWQLERSAVQPSPAITPSSQRSIAVLPVAFDSTADERVQLFAGASHDELVSRLARIDALDNVISGPAVLDGRGTPKSAVQIGREFGVKAVLKSRLRAVGDSINLNVQLIDTGGTDAVLWGDTYTKTLTAQNFFAIQSEMAVAVADALDAKLTADELARVRDVPTTSTRAYEFYLSGNDLWRRNYNPNNTLQLVVQQFKKATDEDPRFALAWARLAIAHTGMYFRGLDPREERLALADAAISKVFELAPWLPEAHLAKAAYLGRGLGDYDGALAELAVAEAGLREDPEFYYLRAGMYMQKGEWELSLADHEKMLAIEPTNVAYLRQRSQVEISMHDYAAVARTLDRIVDLAPDDGTAHVDRVFLALYAHGDTTLANERLPPLASYSTALALTYVRWLAAVFDRDYAKALSVLDSSSEEWVFDGDLRNSFSPKSLLYARTNLLAGDRTEALRQLGLAKDAIEQRLKSQPVDREPSAPLQIALAEVQAALGDHAGALASLARAGTVASAKQRSGIQLAVAIRVLVPLGEHERALKEIDDYLDGTGKWTIEGLLVDPRLDRVRSDPRFTELVAKHKSVGG